MYYRSLQVISSSQVHAMREWARAGTKIELHGPRQWNSIKKISPRICTFHILLGTSKSFTQWPNSYLLINSFLNIFTEFKEFDKSFGERLYNLCNKLFLPGSSRSNCLPCLETGHYLHSQPFFLFVPGLSFSFRHLQ